MHHEVEKKPEIKKNLVPVDDDLLDDLLKYEVKASKSKLVIEFNCDFLIIQERELEIQL